MPARVTPEELFQALDDALVLCEEFAGADVAMRLAAFGLRVDEVRAELEQRRDDLEGMYANDPAALYTQGFVEGVMAGVSLVRRAMMAAR